MSGHNKWSTIKHKKAKTDAQKSKHFSKVVREIMMATKLGGPDPDSNPRLRLALQKGKEVNLPADNVKRAIQKGAGGDSAAGLEEHLFEAYGPHGVAILIQTLTDNKNRTVPNLRYILTRSGGNLAERGAVSYLFDSKGFLIFDADQDEDRIIDIATTEDAEDIDTKDDGSIEVISDPSTFMALKDAFDQAKIAYITAEISMIPSSTVSLDLKATEKIISLLEQIEEDDDVQEVYSNIDIPDELV